MKKKFLALVLTLAMVLSLVPVTALATDGPSGTAPDDVVYGHYTNTGEWESGKPENAIPGSLKDTVTTVDKTAEKVTDNQYKVTLKVEMKHKTTEVPPGAAATVLVIDTSGSMEKDTKCNKKEHVHDSNCYTWEECTQENHPNHYWWDYWTKEYKHIWPTSCTWDRDGNRYVYQRLICDKEEHRHGRNCETTSRIAAAKVAARNFLNSYRGGTVSEDGTWTPSATPLERYVSIVSFNKYVSKNDWVDVSTPEGYDAAIASINALSAEGGTNLDAGLRMANAQLNNGTVKGMSANVVVLTDGKPTYHLKKAKNQNKNSDVEIEGVKYSVKGKGYETSEDTYNQTVKTAATLRQAASVYTVCFGASNERLEAEDEPTVSEFLKTNIATQQAEGQTYAYDANDTTDLYKAFAAISSSVVSGLKTGTVTDALPNGVSCVTNGTFDENGNLTWRLDPEKATKSEPDSNDFITYTYEKKYTVEINPEAEGLNVENGYVPLNRPTKLTVQHNDSPVQIPFPIPAGKVTYSLTGFEKALVTNQNKPDGLTIPSDVTIPANTTEPVTVGENGVTLLYKITVEGDKGAKFIVRDDGATLVSPDTIADGEDSTFSGTVDSTGTTVFYVSKQFTQDNIVESGDKKTVSNTATIDPGDNANGPADNEKTKTVTTTVTEATPQTYTVIFDAKGGNWSENETQRTETYSGSSASVTRPEEPTKSGYLFVAWTYENADGSYEEIPNGASLTVNQLMNLPKADTANRKVTLYAKWRLNPEDQITYTIRQHYWKNLNDNDTDTGDNVSIKNLTAKSGEKIASLIDGKNKNQDWRGYRYLYDNQQTKVTVPEQESTKLTDGAVLSVSGTVIDLYYYLDSWKDGDTQKPAGNDEKTGGDGTPDYKQILIEYKAHTPLVGEVSREFEIQTLTDDQKVATPTGAKAKAKENVAYAFAYWIKGEVDPEKTEAKIENTAICYEKQLSGVTIDPVTGGETYIYTAVFLKDVTGKIEEGKEKPDGIPDAWQCKVTFKVVNGNWNDNTNKEIVTYVTKKNAEGKGSTNGTAKLTAGQIPPVGNQPSSGYTASGSWDKTPPTDFNITGDTVFTYTYDQKSGGSGGSGGSNRPKPPVVEIPDDVPTGLNGKDHYAYVVGYPDGMVYPQKNITRAEVATIFFRLLTDETREANMTKSNGYNDMKDGAWYTCAVSTLSKMGIIKGYEDGSFKPDASISRAEFAAIAARFDPDGDKTPATFSDVSSHWAKDEISIAANHGWIKGYEDGSFKPDQKITRAETMTLVNRVLKRLPETKDDLHKDMKTWPDNQNESAWFYLAVQEATNSHYQKLKKDGTHETWESMRETRDWAALEK